MIATAPPSATSRRIMPTEQQSSSASAASSSHPPQHHHGEHQRFAFRASLALSNMAVTMMTRRQCYGQAFETLKDAAMIMTTSVSSSESCSMAKTEITLRLELANARMARPEPSAVKVPVQVVSHATRLNSQAFDQWTNSATEAAHTVIEIDPEEVSELQGIKPDSDGEVSHLPSAIVLYNLAIASFCLSQTCAQQNNMAVALALHEIALTNLILARNIVSLLFSTCQDPFWLLRVIFVKAVVLRTLFSALRNCGQVEEATSCVSILAGLERLASELVHLDQIQRTPSAPAA